ncbi:MAG: PLP-dependent aminotransferase family protein [Sneathiella sp.]|nr:PLP-dependent aminotransferase family protein [Sneathiella sp.]
MIIIEDDFESETNYLGEAVPAMKAVDLDGRIIYVGSLSKSMFPGLRLGYIVANADLIDELRGLRRLMLRHAPSNNQRTTSLFISQGFHDTYIRKLNRVYLERWKAMKDGIETFFPGMSIEPSFGGTSFWFKGAQDLDSEILARQAREHSIIIEPGHPHFQDTSSHKNYFRLGFSSIATEEISEGLRNLAALLP